jgi:hypothetical protein
LLELFRKNYLPNVIIFILYVFVIRIGSVIFTHTYNLEQVDTLIYKLIFNAFGSDMWRSIALICLIIIQGLILNQIAVNHRLSKESTLMTALVYVIFTSLISYNNVLCGAIIANTFVILALKEILKYYKENNATPFIFNTGFFISIAGSFYNPYLLMVFLGLFGLLILRSFRLKEILQYLAGYFSFIILLVTFRYWFGYKPLDILNVKNIFFRLPNLDLNQPVLLYVGILVMLLMLIYTLLSYGSVTGKKAVQVQKKIDIMYWFLLLNGICFIIFTTYGFTHLVTLAVPISVIIGITLSDSKAKVLPELIHIILIAIIFMSQFGLLNF